MKIFDHLTGKPANRQTGKPVSRLPITCLTICLALFLVWAASGVLSAATQDNSSLPSKAGLSAVSAQAGYTIVSTMGGSGVCIEGGDYILSLSFSPLSTSRGIKAAENGLTIYKVRSGYLAAVDTKPPILTVTASLRVARRQDPKGRRDIYITYSVSDNRSRPENIIVTDGNLTSIPDKDGSGRIGPYAWAELSFVILTTTDECNNSSTTKAILIIDDTPRDAAIIPSLQDGLLSGEGVATTDILPLLAGCITYPNDTILEGREVGAVSVRAPPSKLLKHEINRVQNSEKLRIAYSYNAEALEGMGFFVVSKFE